VAGFRSWLGEFELAEAAAREAVTVAREVHDDDALALALSMVSQTMIERGSLREARPFLEEAIEIRSRVENEVHLISVLANAGVLAGRLGDLEEAGARHREAWSATAGRKSASSVCRGSA
jgi:tetratricopeptide (TPR) repeat protein